MDVAHRRLVLASGLLIMLFGLTTFALAQTLTSEQQVAQAVSVRDLEMHAGTVSGLIQNKSTRLLRDVRLLVRYAWVWKNEHHPGDDNPGRAEYYTAPGEVAAGGTARFSYRPDPPLPTSRSDGHFVLSAEIVSFTEVGK